MELRASRDRLDEIGYIDGLKCTADKLVNVHSLSSEVYVVRISRSTILVVLTYLNFTYLSYSITVFTFVSLCGFIVALYLFCVVYVLLP